MPELEDHELQQFADSLVPSNKTVSIRIGDAWQSPLLAPNGSVFPTDLGIEDAHSRTMQSHGGT